MGYPGADIRGVVGPESPRLVRWSLVACLAWVACYALQCWTPSHPLSGSVLGKYASDAAMLSAGLLCAWRGLTIGGRERAAWLLVAGGIGAWALGDLYWSAK